MRPSPLRIALVLLLAAGAAAAESQFASNGLGVTLRPTHVRGWTMGGLTTALGDTLRLSLANPAEAGGMREVSMSILYLADRRTARDGNGDERFSGSGFPLFEFLIPFGSRFAAGFGYVEEQDLGTARTRIPFDFGEDAGVPHTRYFERRGAVFRVPGALSFRLFRDVRFGFRLDNYFFNVEEDYDLDFDDPAVRSTRERLLLSGSGAGATVGLLLPLGQSGHVGLVYTTSATLEGTREREGASGSVAYEDLRVGLPERFGAGFSLTREGYTLGGEVDFAGWGDVKDTLTALGGYEDVTTWAVGVERMPRREDPWFVRFPFRGGYRVETMPLVTNGGNDIKQWSFSLGSSLPLGIHRSVCDFGLEYGVIGSKADVGLEERYYRFLVGFAAQEPWRARKSYVE